MAGSFPKTVEHYKNDTRLDIAVAYYMTPAAQIVLNYCREQFAASRKSSAAFSFLLASGKQAKR